jgi:ATP-binding cassette subfamily B protein
MNVEPNNRRDDRLGYGDLLRAYLRPQWRSVLALAALLAAGIALQLANPQLLRVFIDQALGGAELGALARLAAVFLAVAVLSQLVVVGETFVAENVGLSATNAIRADLTRHCLGLDLSFHHAHPPGELIERIDGDVTALGNFFSRFVVQIFGNAVLLVAMLVLLVVLDPLIGGAITLCTGLSLAVMLRLRNLAVPARTAERQASAELFSFLEEHLAGTEDLRSSGATDHALRRLAERSLAMLRRTQRATVIGSLTGGAAGYVFLTVITVVGLGLSASRYLAGALTIGEVYLVFSYTQLLRWPIDQITRQLQDLQRATASVARIRDLQATRSSVEWLGQTPLPRGALPVELERVWFGYDEGEAVLRDVSLAIRPGEIVGLLGRTGSGKTTLERLVSRLYDPAAGAIHLGGIDLRDAAQADVRRAVGVVTQEIQLFHASVRDNLTLFDPSVSEARLAAVLRELGLASWCDSLPAGLATRLAPDGSGLSAGEAQLLAFARVFLQDPGLVILDEASSRLDPATERRIELALDRLLRGRTAIIIAHRLATVRRADTIVILENGEIRECGPRERLANDPNSHFAELLRLGLEEALA